MKYINYLSIPHKHLGRDFTGCDCFGLIRLFYQEEFKIQLPDYQDYQQDWHLSDAKYIIRSYSKAGFKKVKDQPRYGDVLLLNEAGYPKHLGVVIEGGSFLHTLISGTCCHSYMQREYLGKIHSVYRYKKGLPSCK